MGVQGLWQLLQPTGRPVTLESLEGKILAVDISIWLHHLVKGMRDRQGNQVPNAHLLGMYNRICKLLYYRIKPVFVFDGGVPELKKQTMAKRRHRKEEADAGSSRTAKKLLNIMLKKHAVNTVLGNSSRQPGSSQIRPVSLGGKQKGPDIFDLPPLPEADRPSELEDYNDAWEERMELRNEFLFYDDPDDVDIDSSDFQALPGEIQHEVLMDIREKRKYHSSEVIASLPQESDDFSDYQLKKLMKQSKVLQHLDRVRKSLNAQESGDMAANLTTSQRTATEILSNRIISEDSSHFILIKGLRNIEEEDEKPKIDSAKAVQEIFEQKRMENEKEREGKVRIRVEECMVKMENMDSEDDAKNYLVDEGVVITNVVEKTDYLIRDVDIDLTKNYDETTIEKDDSFESPRKKVPERAYRQLPNTDSAAQLSSDEDGDDIFIDAKQKSGEAERKSNEMAEKGLVGKNYAMEGGFVRDSSDEENGVEHDDISMESSTNLMKHDGIPHEMGIKGKMDVEEVLEMKNTETNEDLDKGENVHINDETGEVSEGEKDFLEISIDTTSSQPDEDLFPASIFTQGNQQHSPPADVVMIGKQTSPDMDLHTDMTDNELHMDDDILADNEFEGMTKTELYELQQTLETETAELHVQRQKQERVAASITDQMYTEAQELLELFGLPYLVSPMEAEAQCAHLDLTNQTHGTITDDSDVWLFGGKRVYKNFFNQNKDVEFYQHNDISRLMLLDRVGMINVALLCGSDYTEGIQGVGPVTAMEILGEFQMAGAGLGPLVLFKKWWDAAQKQARPPVESKVKVQIRQLEIDAGFPSVAVVDAYMKPTVDSSEDSFTWGKPDLDLLRVFAEDKFGWSQTRSDELLLPMMKQLSEKQYQMRMTSYMISEPMDNHKLKSKRVKRILNQMRTNSALDDIITNSSSKGKATSRAEVKNSSKKGGKKMKTDKSTVSAPSGGWIQSVRKVPSKVELSESSSDSDVGFKGSDSDDALLASIDLESIQTAAKSVENTSMEKVEQIVPKNVIHSVYTTHAKPVSSESNKRKCRDISKIKENSTSNSTKCTDYPAKMVKTSAPNQIPGRRGRGRRKSVQDGANKGRGRGRGRGSGRGRTTVNEVALSNSDSDSD